MAVEMKVPAVGESISEVTIANWNKKDGDFVKKDEILCELESDKATFEVTAEVSGILKIVAPKGTTLPIGGLICSIEPSAAAAEPAKTAATPAAAPAKAAAVQVVDMVVPAVGESISEVTVASWSKKDGDSVKKDEVLCEIESEKATFELTASHSGVLRIVAAKGQTLAIGALICRIEAGAQPQADAQAAAAVTQAPASAPSPYAVGHPSPAASKILAEKGIDTAQVQGSGVGGRITKEDAEKASKPAEKAPAAPASAPASAPVSASSSARNERREKMTSLRKTVARRLVAVKNETAMLTTFNEVDMKPIMDIRAKYKDSFKEKYGVGLGFMSFFTKACCIALQEFPAVNARIEGDELVFNDFCDISVAVSAPKGLVVPVIRNAEKMSFNQIEAEIVALAKKARDNKLSIPEMTGGTFTITNGGVFGSMMSTPIINAPQSAILGMHNIVERAVVVGGEVVVRPMMYVALSYDHRIIDGRESVGFLVRVKQLLEDPSRMLLGI